MATENDRKKEALDFILAQFPKRYQIKNTTYLYGLMAAIAEGDGIISAQVEAGRDNLITVTATGKNLDILASRYGVIRGQGTGVQDDDFRDLIPILGLSPKQITHTILQLIDTIYGPYASHANITCSRPAPYHIIPGTKLDTVVDGQLLKVYFAASDFLNPLEATADEVATAISNFTKGKIIGSVVTNTRTGDQYVNIRTSTIGSQGFIQVIDGDVQKAMHFPTIRPTRQDIATWQVTRYNGTDQMVYTAVAGISPGLRAAGVKKGDLVTLRLDSGFEVQNCGSFEVTFVDEDSFRIRNGAGIPEGPTLQLHVDDFVFYRPDLGNILLSNRPATVLETGVRELTILIPVTSPIVKRTLRGGHHFHGGITTAISTTTDTITVASTDQFEASGAVHVITSRIDSRGTCSSVSPGIVSLVSSEGWPSAGSFYSATTQTFYYFSGKTGNNLTGVTPQPPASLAGASLKYVERYSYSGIADDTLQNVFPDPSNIEGLEIAIAGATSDPIYPGSFLYDLQAPFIAANAATTLSEKISQGSSTIVLKANDISMFDPTGYFVIEFATGEQEGPIKYLGKVGSEALIVDPGHVYERDHLAGVTLRQVRQIGAAIPRRTGEDLAIYMTSTSPARDLLAQYIQDVVAAGITIKFDIIIPEQKWAILPQLYSTSPIATSLV